MAAISIVGTSGVGKSFLVKQLASLKQAPAFFEGEEGTIPHQILKSIFNGSNPIKRYKFFMERYRKNLETAMAISKKLGIDCYIDGATLSNKAILTFEEGKYKNSLTKMLEDYKHLKSDIIILLTADKKTLQKYINIRARDSEAHNKAIGRALKIQDVFISLAQKEKNMIIVNRTNMDFTKYEDIQAVLNKIERCKQKSIQE